MDRKDAKVCLGKLFSQSRKNITVYVVGKKHAGKTTFLTELHALWVQLHAVISVEKDASSSLSFVEDDYPAVSASSGRNMVIYLYDVCDGKALDDLATDHKFQSLAKNRTTTTKSYVVGNKIDLEYWRKIGVQEGRHAAQTSGAKFCEVSCLTGQHLDIIADVILAELYPLFADKSIVKECVTALATPVIAPPCSWSDDDDVMLSQLHKGMTRLHGIGASIKAELVQQDALLNFLDNDIDQDETRTHTQTAKWSSKKSRKKRSNLADRKQMDDNQAVAGVEHFLASPALTPSPAAPALSNSAPRTPLDAQYQSDNIDWDNFNTPLEPCEDEAEGGQYDGYIETIEEEREVCQHSPMKMDPYDIGSDDEDVDTYIEDVDVDVVRLAVAPSEKVSLPADAAATTTANRKEGAQAASERRKPSLQHIHDDLQDVRNIMHENTDGLVGRSEKLDDLLQSSLELEINAKHFYQNSKRVDRCNCCVVCMRDVTECVCAVCSTCATESASCLRHSMSHAKSCLCGRNSLLFDNVLADTENAFQALAKLLNSLCVFSTHVSTWKLVIYATIGWWCRVLIESTAFVIVFVSSVLLILPSFFTLLIVRTTTIEKESKAFGVRQEVIRHEKKSDSLIRWLRIFLRSLPLSFYMMLLPYLLVYELFPRALAANQARRITVYLVIYLCGVIVLQILGSLRAYSSWKTRDNKDHIPPAPYMYEVVSADDEDSDDGDTKGGKWSVMGILNSKQTLSKSRGPRGVRGDGVGSERSAPNLVVSTHVHLSTSLFGSSAKCKKSDVPLPPNTFKLTTAANVIELISLSIEFLQMASFALQSSPYSVDDTDDTGDDGSDTSFWGEKLFKVLYLHIPGEKDVQYACMWGAVGIVSALIILFSTQFHAELREYGALMVDPAQKDFAKDSFFFSFTGAIVYGHGKPNNVSTRMRLLVTVLSDTLFLIVSFQLLKVFSCDYNSASHVPVLRADDSIVCWEGPHALLATIAMICYSYYVPLSVMITPMLLESPPPSTIRTPTVATDTLQRDASNAKSTETVSLAAAPGGNGGVAYLKLYLMTVNVVKSLMLLVGVLGPESVSTAVLSSCVASVVLGGITLLWFGQQDINRSHYSSNFHPCNIAFINYWKGASYASAVASAVIVLAACYLQDTGHFPPSVLTLVLISVWVGIIAVFVIAYKRFQNSTKDRRALIEALIVYPFYFRDIREAIGQTTVVGSANTLQKVSPASNGWLFGSPFIARNRMHIPGCHISPWADTVSKELLDGAMRVNQGGGWSSCPAVVVDVESVSGRLAETITSLLIRRSYAQH